MLPQKIGAEITISSYDAELKRYVDWDGFTLVRGTPQTFTMRRDYASGAFSAPEPPRPDSLASVRIVKL